MKIVILSAEYRPREVVKAEQAAQSFLTATSGSIIIMKAAITTPATLEGQLG